MNRLFENAAMNEVFDALEDVRGLLGDCARVGGLVIALGERTAALFGDVMSSVHTPPTPRDIATIRDQVSALRAEVDAFVAS
jgi:hypothetical protein